MSTARTQIWLHVKDPIQVGLTVWFGHTKTLLTLVIRLYLFIVKPPKAKQQKNKQQKVSQAHFSKYGVNLHIIQIYNYIYRH